MATETHARTSIGGILSLASCIAWLTIAYSGDCAVMPRTSAFEATSTFLVTATLGMGISLLLCALLPKIGWRAVTSRSMLLVVGVLCGATTFASGFEAAYPPAVFLLCAFAAGFFYGIVLVRCSLLRLDADSRTAATGVCLATIIGTLMYALSSLIAETHSTLWVLVITSALPLGSAVAGLLDTGKNLPMHDSANDALAPAFWRVMAFIGVLSFFLSFVRGFYPRLISSSAFASSRADAALMIVVAMILIGLVLATRSRRSAFERIYYYLFLVAAIITLPLALLGAQSAISGSFATLSKAILYLAVWCFLELWSFKTGMSPVRVFGFGAGSTMIGSFAGYLLGSSAYGIMGQSLNPAFALILALICLAAATMLLRSRDLEGFMVPTAEMVTSVEGPNGEDSAAHATAPETEEIPKSYRPGRFKARCHLIAEEFGLTAREKDVFILLAKHMPIQAIADELVVSFNTARTHVRHIYAKLGVHNRQELVELIESYEVEG